MRRAALLVLLALASSSACYLQGWLDMLNAVTAGPGASDEYRVRDLRVLAIRADAPEVLIPARAIFGDDAARAALPPQTLDVVIDAFDPRGGVVDVSVQLCASAPRLIPAPFGLFAFGDTLADVFARCAERRFDDAPAGVAAAFAARPARLLARASTTDAPFGPIDGFTASFALDGAALLDAWTLAGAPPPRLVGGELHVVVKVSRVVSGVRESEWAYLSMPLRIDATDPELPDEERAGFRESVGGAEPCAPEWVPRCLGLVDDAPPECGDYVVDEGEACDPPDGIFCRRDCTLVPEECLLAPACILPFTPHRRPRVLGTVPLDAEVYDTLFLRADDPRITPLDDVIDLPPSRAIGLAVVVERRSLDVFQMLQPIYRDPVFDDAGVLVEEPEPPPPDGGTPEPEYLLFVGNEFVTTRVYVVGEEGTLRETWGDERTQTFGGGSGAFLFEAPDGAGPGDELSVLVVVSDQRGGLDVGRIRLRVP